MTRQQVDGFKEYVRTKNPAFFEKMDSVCVFMRDRDDEDRFLLLHNAFQPVLPSKADRQIYSELLAEFKKVNKIYAAVPSIVDDFVKYLWTLHRFLAFKLDGDVGVIFEEGVHKLYIHPRAKVLTEAERDELNAAWIQFYSSLTQV